MADRRTGSRSTQDLTTWLGGRLADCLTLPYFLASVCASRLILLGTLYRLTGGHELSNDTAMLMSMLRFPLAVLTYAIPDDEQLPPLEGMFEAIIGYPLSLCLSDFLTLRIVMILYEVLVAFLFYRLLEKCEPAPARKGFALMAYLVLPMGWMTSVVLAQDDPIGAAILLVVVLLMTARRVMLALFLCGFGVLAGKLFLGVSLLTLLSFCRGKQLLRGAVAGFSPIVLVYGGMTIHRLMHGLPLPLLGFRPDPYFGTNFWMLLRTYAAVDLRAIGPYSGLLALIASLTPALIVRLAPQIKLSAPNVARAAAASLMIFFSLFYHVNPEYFLLLFPLMVVTAENVTDAACCVLVSVLPWATKFFQNAQYMSEADVNSGKEVALSYFKLIFRSSPELWLAGSQAVFTVVMFMVSLRWCAKMPTSRSPECAARSDVLAD